MIGGGKVGDNLVGEADALVELARGYQLGIRANAVAFGRGTVDAGGRPGSMETVVKLCAEYPRVNITLNPQQATEATLFVRIPGWVEQPSTFVNDKAVLKILRGNALRTFR